MPSQRISRAGRGGRGPLTSKVSHSCLQSRSFLECPLDKSFSLILCDIGSYARNARNKIVSFWQVVSASGDRDAKRVCKAFAINTSGHGTHL